MSKYSKNLLLLFIPFLFASCYGIRPSNGGGQISNFKERRIDPADVALPEGYSIEVVATGLTFPSAITFDDQGTAYVLEAGYSYGEVFNTPRLLKINPDGLTSVIAQGENNGPWNGITFHDGSFYVAEGGELKGGKILKISKEGNVTSLVEGLPSLGDHHTNGPLIHNGYIYFGQGTATNSGVVGEDNADFGWLKRNPDFHDIPCKDIILKGKNYETPNLLTDDSGDKASTGAFVAFNTPTKKGQVIKGAVPCSGALLRVPVSGGTIELAAWGFRNPFGLAEHEGKVYVLENGFDVRGSRPAWGTGDVLWEIKEGTWYGWPDYSAGKPLDHHEYKVPGKGKAQLVLKENPNKPPKPAAILGVHSSSNGLDFSTNDAFGYRGKAFVAQFGDMASNVGKVLSPVGYKVVMVDVETGVITDFAVNRGKKNGPATWLKEGGLERPVTVKFSNDGKSLYVVDFGVLEMTKKGSYPKEKTGVVWKITKQK